MTNQISPSDLVSEPAVAKPQAPQTATADQFPDPQSSTVADGQRGVPSSTAGGAKSEWLTVPSSVGTALADRQSIQAEHAVTNSHAQPSSSPEAHKAETPISSPAVSASPFEKPGCLKLKNGHCKIGFETTALCSQCNAERMKATAA